MRLTDETIRARGACQGSMDTLPNGKPVALVFAGGVGLGAYAAGAYAALAARAVEPAWVAGASIGAVNAALIAGCAPERRLGALREFWRGAGQFLPLPRVGGELRHAANWLSVLQARLFGAPGHFRPAVPELFRPPASLYSLAPLRTSIERLVDFGRLNAGEMRVSVGTTDVETGESVMFDTARGDRITPDHLLASCGLMPEFAPMEFNGRLLGDGGLSANAPALHVLYDEPAGAPRAVFVVDLFARDGARPTGLESALSRKNELFFANQTWTQLAAWERATAGGAKANGNAQTVFYLSYRAPPEEAGPEKLFDYSPASLDGRWRAGELDMQAALARFSAGGELPALNVIRRAAA
jgi:NTE family protein